MSDTHDAMDIALRLQQAAYQVESVHHFHGSTCLCGFQSDRSRSRTEHITQAIVKKFNDAAPTTGGGEGRG